MIWSLIAYIDGIALILIGLAMLVPRHGPPRVLRRH